MNVLDIAIAIVLAGTALYGLLKGFVRIAVGVAGFGISLAFALRLCSEGPAWFSGVFASAEAAVIAAFVALLVLGLIGTAFAAFLAHRLVKSAQISWIDRLAGTALGVGGGSLLIAGLLVGLTTFLPAGSRVLEDSALVPYAIRISDVAAHVLPPDMAEVYRERRARLGVRTEVSRAEAREPLRDGRP